MPNIKIEISKQTKEKKKEMIEKLAKTMSEITSIPQEAFVVWIQEYDADNIGPGGVPLSECKK